MARGMEPCGPVCGRECADETSGRAGGPPACQRALQRASSLSWLPGTYKELFQTTNGSTQGLCTCILTQGSDGIIYGTALGGGPGGFGLIFALDAGLPIPKPRALRIAPETGAVG